jgi:ComF family protein
MLQTLFKELLDILFPKFCVSCGKEGVWWCAQCRAKEPVNLQHFCPRCSQVLEPFTPSNACPVHSSLSGVTALYQYTDQSAIKELIHSFKYRNIRGISEVWEEILRVLVVPPAWRSAVVVPVPLFNKRLRERGYNQSELLAQILAKQNSMVLNAANLIRTRHTVHQVGLTRAERLKNTVDAFAWVGEQRAPEKVILVDDVCTTGSTLENCAKALKARGCQEVWAVVLARD